MYFDNGDDVYICSARDAEIFFNSNATGPAHAVFVYLAFSGLKI